MALLLLEEIVGRSISQFCIAEYLLPQREKCKSDFDQVMQIIKSKVESFNTTYGGCDNCDETYGPFYDFGDHGDYCHECVVQLGCAAQLGVDHLEQYECAYTFIRYIVSTEKKKRPINMLNRRLKQSTKILINIPHCGINYIKNVK